ncbi:MAG: CapA family protein [Lachnospiraceae bacterium]|nr:CapA family protein [Lachnospiraceae bacterium]
MKKFLIGLYIGVAALLLIAGVLLVILVLNYKVDTTSYAVPGVTYTPPQTNEKENEPEVSVVSDKDQSIDPGVNEKEPDGKEPVNDENDNAESDSNEIVSEEPVNEKVKPIDIILIGDTYFNERRQANYDKEGISGVLSDSLIEKTQNADIAMLDFECAFTERGEFDPDKEYSYRMKPESAKAFKDMGFDVASLANNHSLDFGTIGLTDTFDTLDDLGIEYVGAGDTIERAERPAVFEVGGRTVAFLAASRVIPVVEWNVLNRQPGMLCTYDDTALCEAIKKAKSEYDYVIVYAHWGVMETDVLEKYQVTMAHDYIDCGADLVFGSHPHVIQGTEVYKGKPVFYSLGNFLYGSNIARTFMLNAVIDEEGVLSAKVLPCYASNGKTMEMDKENGEKLFDYLNTIAVNCYIDDDGFLREAN